MEEEQRKGMHIIIFTRALGGRGHGRMHKGKDGGKGDLKIERLNRKKAGRRGNRSKGGKYEKKGRDRSLLKFYTLGKRKNYAIRNNWINILRGTF